ncbi:hypothetical protein quinque_005237 [Culex quinquefasciatus]
MICTSETRPLDACFQDHLANHAPPVVLEPVDFTDDVSTARAVNGWIQSTILSRKGTCDDGQCLADVVDAIPEDYLNTVNDSLTEHWVDVHIPTITVTMKTSVNDVLSKLDCAGIFELKDLKVFADGQDQLDRFYQHCWFRMDENGAQTNAPLAESPQVTFTADRPFLFVVRKANDSAVVMIGDYSIYVDPNEQF